MSSISLEELLKLSKSTQKTKPTSGTQLIPIPSSENSSNPGASLVLSKKNKTALEQFEHSIGGRDSLIETLELAPLDKKQEHLLNLLLDPGRKNDSINTIAKDAGMKPAAVIELFRTASFAKAHALAMAKMAEALPSVVEDIAAKSVDQKVECPTCFGQKKISNVDCPTCYGKGQVMRYSDLDRQKILLEGTGVTKKGGGVNVNVNQQVAVTQPGSFFSSFVKNTDQTAYAIDAEIIEPKDETLDGD